MAFSTNYDLGFKVERLYLEIYPLGRVIVFVWGGCGVCMVDSEDEIQYTLGLR